MSMRCAIAMAHFQGSVLKRRRWQIWIQWTFAKDKFESREQIAPVQWDTWFATNDCPREHLWNFRSEHKADVICWPGSEQTKVAKPAETLAHWWKILLIRKRLRPLLLWQKCTHMNQRFRGEQQSEAKHTCARGKYQTGDFPRRTLFHQKNETRNNHTWGPEWGTGFGMTKPRLSRESHSPRWNFPAQWPKFDHS